MKKDNIFESLSGVKIPIQIYGTAWKKERTADLVVEALSKGFRGVDTACQPRHYNEPLVGEGISRSGIKRSELFIQTKFTPFGGQDTDNCPYNPSHSLEDQIKTSLSVSLQNLKTDYLDSLVLHSPLKTLEETLQAWNVLESFVERGVVKQIGLSNCYDHDFFCELFQKAKVKPAVLQNRFYAESDYDKNLRSFCNEKGIYYQCFWTVKANTHTWESSTVLELAERLKKSPLQVFFRSLIYDRIHPLYGTTNSTHMEEAMDLFNFTLESEDIEKIKTIGQY
jgi:diketogulonate reductase-like aldo/keto reductase